MHKNISDFVNLGKYHFANKNLLTQPDVIFVGDSITEDWQREMPDFFSENNFCNRGISGQITSQILLRFYADVILLRPKRVFILAGINDIAENFGPMNQSVSLNNIAMMCNLAIYNKIEPIVSTLTPANYFFWKPEANPKEDILSFNQMLKDYCKINNIRLFDAFLELCEHNNQLPEIYSRDGGHLTKLAYQKLSLSIVDFLKS